MGRFPHRPVGSGGWVFAGRDTPEEVLNIHHFGLGSRIRNEFGLWQGNDQLLASCFPDATDPYMLVIIKHDPDGASRVIVGALWERLQSPEQARGALQRG